KWRGTKYRNGGLNKSGIDCSGLVYLTFKRRFGIILPRTTEEMVIDAKEALILRRETHLDQLADKLREERVRKIIAPMIEGIFIENINPDDLQYVIDLGLVKREHSEIKISNPIYREVIPRELTTITQYNLGSAVQAAWYIAKDGSLDVSKLLKGFQEFFRENSESWVERFQYKEAGPQLLMQALVVLNM
ncbi:MAG: C40 family peptidase, partial [Desulfamplus sp.]|nr:C40 family peptidase [Desulfamplus sp.]